jgi:hypothetical protein
VNPNDRGADLKAQLATAYKGSPPAHVIICRSPLSAYITRRVFQDIISGEFPWFDIPGVNPMRKREIKIPRLLSSIFHALWISGAPSFRQQLEATIKNQARRLAEDSRLQGAQSVSREVADRVWETTEALLSDPDLHGFESSVGEEISARAWLWPEQPASSLFDNCISDDPGELIHCFRRYPQLREAVDLRGLFNVGRYGPRHREPEGFETARRLANYCFLAGQYRKAGPVWRRIRASQPVSPTGQPTVSVIGGCYLPHRIFCWVGDLPETLILDEQRRPHKVDGPAIEYSDGWRLYATEGSRLSCLKFEAEQDWQEILGERNPHVQRAMIAKHGCRRFLEELNATVVHEDDYGKLWKTANPIQFVADRALESGHAGIRYGGVGELYRFEGMAFVEVVNSTPNAEGAFADYFLRVPFELQTAREAVAWTFNKQATDYAPDIET